MTKTLVATFLIAIGFIVGFGQGCGSGTSPMGAGGNASGGAAGTTSCDPCVRAQACCVVVLGPENCTGEQLQECMSTPEANRQEILMICTTFTSLNEDIVGCGASDGGGGSGGGSGGAAAEARASAVGRAARRASP